MSDEETPVHPAVTVADKVGQKVAHHIAQAAAKGAQAETERRAAAMAAVAESLRNDLKPAMHAAFGPVVAALPDDDPLKQFFDLFMSPESVLNDAFINILGFAGMCLAAVSQTGQVFFQPLLNELWASRPRRPLSPADLATGAVRGIVPGGPAITHYPTEINTEANYSGVSDEDMQFLTDITGMPPSPQDLFEMYRRGIITMDDIATGLKEGDTRDEWIASFQKLAYTWLTPLDFVRAAVQDQLTYAEAEDWAHKTGLDTTTDVGGGQSMFDLAFHIAGRPPGPEEAGRMANRGIIDWTGTGASSVSFQQVVAESDVKTKYTAALRALQAYVPPPRMIGGLLEKGGITEDQARTYWKMGGVPAELVDAYVYEATQQATVLEKNLAKGETLSAYFDRIIDRTTATELLHLLGYSGQVATYMLDVSDFRRELKALNAEVNRIGGYYMHYKITEVEAENRLGALGVPTDQIAGLLEIWSVDRVAPVRIPTVGQISKAVQYGTLSVGEALEKLETLGYTPYDAAIVLSGESEQQIKPLPAQSGSPKPVV